MREITSRSERLKTAKAKIDCSVGNRPCPSLSNPCTLLVPLYHPGLCPLPLRLLRQYLALSFSLLAAVLLTLVSVSTPTWDKIYFLNAGSGNVVRFGVFGSPDPKLASAIASIQALSRSAIEALHTPVILKSNKNIDLASCRCGIGWVGSSSVASSGVSCHRAGIAAMILLTALANVVCIMAFLFDMVLFGIARNSFRSQGIPSQYGNACWLTLAAFVSIFLGFSTAAWGMFSHYKKRTKTGF
ncbi:hypothetical protein C8R46DRAFT_16488 [Mycena filopes]|nr:hypothetical protein C8R46DRAFT_16488 [Mycena filopes]